MKTAIQRASPSVSPPLQAGILVALLLAASFMLAYGCAGNQPGAGVGVDSPPPPPGDESIAFAVVGVNDVPPPPPSN